MRKILVIAYLFPPAGGVMVQRILKFVKYLPHFGWEPTVLTVRNPDYKILDLELFKDVPGKTKIIRTPTVEPSKAFKFFNLILKATRGFIFRRETNFEKRSFDPMLRRSLVSRISNFIFIPDNRVGWLPFAFYMIVKNLRRNKIDVIFSTSPPFSVHLVGLIAKFVLKKPLIVDLRDLWLLNPHNKVPTRIHLWISKGIERGVFNLADRVITVSDPLSEDLRKTYPDISSDKFRVIPNGYDADDFNGVSRDEINKKFTIGHIGSLSFASGRSSYYFLSALTNLTAEVPDFAQRLKIVFVGLIDEENLKIIEHMTSTYNLRDIVHCVGIVSHSEAIRYMKKSDILLFIIGKSIDGCPSSRGCVSGKLYEYLAAHKPILALAEEGPIKRMLEESKCGVFVDYDDVERIKGEILRYYNMFKEGQLEVIPNWSFITQFERKRLTGQLAAYLNELG